MKQKRPRTAKGDAEFEALERLAHGVAMEVTRPLDARDKALWAAAKRGRGRPRKSAEERAVAVQITVDPALLKAVDGLADRTGKSRSQLIADGLRTVLKQQRRKAS